MERKKKCDHIFYFLTLSLNHFFYVPHPSPYRHSHHYPSTFCFQPFDFKIQIMYKVYERLTNKINKPSLFPHIFFFYFRYNVPVRNFGITLWCASVCGVKVWFESVFSFCGRGLTERTR